MADCFVAEKSGGGARAGGGWLPGIPNEDVRFVRIFRRPLSRRESARTNVGCIFLASENAAGPLGVLPLLPPDKAAPASVGRASAPLPLALGRTDPATSWRVGLGRGTGRGANERLTRADRPADDLDASCGVRRGRPTGGWSAFRGATEGGTSRRVGGGGGKDTAPPWPRLDG